MFMHLVYNRLALLCELQAVLAPIFITIAFAGELALPAPGCFHFLLALIVPSAKILSFVLLENTPLSSLDTTVSKNLI